MTLRLTFGCDPGLSGAIATLLDGEPGPMLDMPTFHNGTANEVNALALAKFIRETRAAHPGAYVTACIERVRAMPNKADGGRRTMGAQSSFNFGDGFGQVKCAFRVLGIEPLFVEAAAWKRQFRLLGQGKDAARELALVRFPNAAGDLRRKKDIGRADALWIALFADGAEARAAA